MPQIHLLDTGCIGTDGGAMFGVVPKSLWQKFADCDENNFVTTALRNLYIEDGQRKIIVDTGIGNYNDNPDFIKHHRPSNPSFDHADALAAYNTTCDQITDLILTHLHFDHTGGIITRRDGQFLPTFPQARIWLQKEQWAWANNPSPKDRAGFIALHLDHLRDNPRLELIDGNHAISENVSTLPFYGHTPAMQCVKINKKGQTHFYTTDLIPLASHLRLPYVMAFDLEPLKTIQEKQKILDQAAQQKWTLIFQHDPENETGTVEKKNNRYHLIPTSIQTEKQDDQQIT
jgi:glyoxylase-like metal-dependent hydrolase (beta-lactamase superfamily II)